MTASLASVSTALGAEGGMSVQAGLLIVDVILFVLLLLAVIGLVAMSARRRSLETVLEASSAGRAALEALERAALPSGASAQELEAAIRRRSEVVRVRADASSRGVPGAGPWGPSWKDAYSISLQLAVAGGWAEARALLRAAAPRSVLPKWLLKKQRGFLVEGLWPKVGRLTRGSECLEAAVAWARLASECRSSDPATASEATTNANRLFGEALWWLPAEDDVPVHLRIAEFRREQGDLRAAVAELGDAEKKVRVQRQSAAATSASPKSKQLADTLASILELRLSIRLQQAGIPELGLAPGGSPVPMAIDAQLTQGIEADLAELGGIRQSVTAPRLAGVRRGALRVRWELARNDQLRADAAAAEGAEDGAPSGLGRIEGLPHFPGEPRLSAAAQEVLRDESTWDRRDQLLLAGLRLHRLWRLRDEAASNADSMARFGGWRAMEDFVEGVTFAWLLYDPRRCVDLPTVQWQLVRVSTELESKIQKSSFDDLQRMIGWLNYVRSRSQVRPQVPTVREPAPAGGAPGTVNPSVSAPAEAPVGSLVCRVASSGLGYGRTADRLEVLADLALATQHWSRGLAGGLELHVSDENGQPLKRIGAFGFPTGRIKVDVVLHDQVELGAGYLGKMARIAILDLSGLSVVPREIRCSVRSIVGARELASAVFPPPSTVGPPAGDGFRVSLEGARDTMYDLSHVLARLLHLSGKSHTDLSAFLTLRDMVHGELGEEGVRELGVPSRDYGPPAVVDVERLQADVAFLDRQGSSRQVLGEEAFADWQRIARRNPRWRAALENLMRRVPPSVLSDEAVSAIGLPRQGTLPARTAWSTPEATGLEPRPVRPREALLDSDLEDLRARLFEGTKAGLRESLDSPSSGQRALELVENSLSGGGLAPQRRERLEALRDELRRRFGLG